MTLSDTGDALGGEGGVPFIIVSISAVPSS
jgi:hypothetical protein